MTMNLKNLELIVLEVENLLLMTADLMDTMKREMTVHHMRLLRERWHQMFGWVIQQQNILEENLPFLELQLV